VKLKPLRHRDRSRRLRLHRLEGDGRQRAGHGRERLHEGRDDLVRAGEAARAHHQQPVGRVDPQHRVGSLGEGARQQVEHDFFLEFLLDLGADALVARFLDVALDLLLHARLDGGGGQGALFGAQVQDHLAADALGQGGAFLAARRHPPERQGLRGPARHEARGLQDFFEGVERRHDEVRPDSEK